jgi:hypothetical protein
LLRFSLIGLAAIYADRHALRLDREVLYVERATISQRRNAPENSISSIALSRVPAVVFGTYRQRSQYCPSSDRPKLQD